MPQVGVIRLEHTGSNTSDLSPSIVQYYRKSFSTWNWKRKEVPFLKKKLSLSILLARFSCPEILGFIPKKTHFPLEIENKIELFPFQLVFFRTHSDALYSHQLFGSFLPSCKPPCIFFIWPQSLNNALTPYVEIWYIFETHKSCIYLPSRLFRFWEILIIPHWTWLQSCYGLVWFLSWCSRE